MGTSLDIKTSKDFTDAVEAFFELSKTTNAGIRASEIIRNLQKFADNNGLIFDIEFPTVIGGAVGFLNILDFGLSANFDIVKGTAGASANLTILGNEFAFSGQVSSGGRGSTFENSNSTTIGPIDVTVSTANDDRGQFEAGKIAILAAVGFELNEVARLGVKGSPAAITFTLTSAKKYIEDVVRDPFYDFALSNGVSRSAAESFLGAFATARKLPSLQDIATFLASENASLKSFVIDSEQSGVFKTKVFAGGLTEFTGPINVNIFRDVSSSKIVIESIVTNNKPGNLKDIFTQIQDSDLNDSLFTDKKSLSNFLKSEGPSFDRPTGRTIIGLVKDDGRIIFTPVDLIDPKTKEIFSKNALDAEFSRDGLNINNNIKSNLVKARLIGGVVDSIDNGIFKTVSVTNSNSGELVIEMQTPPTVNALNGQIVAPDELPTIVVTANRPDKGRLNKDMISSISVGGLDAIDLKDLIGTAVIERINRSLGIDEDSAFQRFANAGIDVSLDRFGEPTLNARRFKEDGEDRLGVNTSDGIVVTEAFFDAQRRMLSRSVTQDENFLRRFGLTQTNRVGNVFRRNSAGKYIGSDGKVLEDQNLFDSAGNLNPGLVKDGSFEVLSTGARITTFTSGPLEGITRIKRTDSNGDASLFQFDQAGAILGNFLGKSLTGDNRVAQLVLSGTLKTVGQTLGGVLNGAFSGASSKDINDVLKSFDNELFRNLSLKGVGAVSAFFVGKVIEEIGISGFVGEIANTALTELARSTISNIIGLQDNSASVNVAAAVGSLLGAKLASKIVSFNTIGGQIGSRVGVSIGSSLGIKLGSVFGGGPLGALAGSAIGAFAGFIVGGLIGSIFGGIPRSAADVQFDDVSGRFVVDNVYSRKGGSKDAARSIASSVAQTYNNVLDATGGTLLNPDQVQAGNYGLRGKDFVYRPLSSRSKDSITQRFGGKDGAERLVGYGVYQGLTDTDFKIAGGNVLLKRALYNTFAIGDHDPLNFTPTTLLGNLQTGQSYANYLANSAAINTIVASESDSVFASEVALNLIRANELGLTKRHESDWYGGFQYLLNSAVVTAGRAIFSFGFDPSTGQVSRQIELGAKLYRDTIDVAGQTNIQGTSGDDKITLTHSSRTIDETGLEFEITGGADRIADAAGLNINGTARTGGQFAVDIAATIDAGDGNDTVHAGDLGNNVFGGRGNDTIFGGRLDDWLIGGEGDDSLNAGSDIAGTFGGDGNYLDGGAGNDMLIGREGSDWLEGGKGTDILEGGGGDDILAGGAGAQDVLRGGLGDDQYIFRIGDADGSGDVTNADIVRDESGLTVQSAINLATAGQVGKVGADISSIEGKLQFRKFGLGKWTGTSGDTVSTQVSLSGGDQVQAGGNDTLVFGAGITLDGISIIKAPNNLDLIIEIGSTKEKILLQDWFNPFNKIENLAFADGQVLRIADFDTFTLGTDGSDYIYGTNGNDFVHGGKGDDFITLLFGNDFGNGGDGNDYVSGDEGNDIVIGLDGNDTVLGGLDQDNVTGGAGNDEVRGGGGNDVVSGDTGNDFVSGGSGNDLYKFERGDGQDVYVDQLSNEWELIYSTAGGFTAGYSRGDVGTPEANHLFYTAPGTTNKVRIFDGAVWGIRNADGSTETVRVEYSVSNGGTLMRHRPADANKITDTVIKTDPLNNNDVIEFGIGIDVSELQFSDAGSSQVPKRDLIIGIEPSGGTTGGFASLTDRIILREWLTNEAVRKSFEAFSFFSSGTINVSALDLKGGTDGVDTLTGILSQGNWITAGAGDDIVTGGSLNDILNGNSGDDVLLGGDGADILFGGTGNDILEGQNGGQFFEGGGTDALGNNLGINAIAIPGGRGDTLIGGEGFDLASYASAVNSVTVNLGNAAANAGLTAGGDTFSSIEGIIGSKFADILTGDNGDNELTGNGSSAGSDQLFGQGGNDTYVFGRNTGSVIVSDQFQTANETIVDEMGRLVEPYVDRFDLISSDGGIFTYSQRVENIDTGEIVYQRIIESGQRLASAPALTSDGWIPGLNTNGKQISRPVIDSTTSAGDDAILIGVSARLPTAFSTGTAVGWSELDFSFSKTSGQTNDLLIRIGSTSSVLQLKNFKTTAGLFSTTSGIETLLLSDGEQAALKGLVFDINGNLGVIGNSEDNLIVDVAGRASKLTGAAGNDVLSGRDGADQLDGGDGDDILSGGSGNDILNGGTGVDTVTYYGAAAATAASVVGTGVSVNLTGAAPLAGAGTSESTGDQFIGIENVIGSDFNDMITGDAFDNVLRGNAGRDTLIGNDGNDVLVGGDGDDTATGGVGDDALEGGDGNDNLTGLGDNDIITGGAGNDILMGDATSADDGGALEISTYNRIVNGSFETLGANSAVLPGWTSLSGQTFTITGAEKSRRLALDGGTSNLEVTQVINGIGSGQELILSFDVQNTSGATGTNFEVFWNGVKLVPSLVPGSTTAYSLNVKGALTGDNILKFAGTGVADGQGATIDLVKLVTKGGGADTLIGGDGDDTLRGNDGSDTLSGGTGIDNIYGGTGDDRLDGGQGNDVLFGGAGNDTYTIFGDGGSDRITVGGGHDSIVYGATAEGGKQPITAEQVLLSRAGNDLVITIMGVTSVVTVVGWFNATPATTASSLAARRIIVGDKAIAQSDVEALFNAQAGNLDPASYTLIFDRVWQPLATYSDRFSITGTDNGETASVDSAIIGGVTFNALGGNDVLNGTGSNDIFDAGTGNDTVNAGAGDDRLTGGADNDQLFGQDGNDMIVYGTEAGFDQVDGGAGNDSIIVSSDNTVIGLTSLTNVEVIDGTAKSNAQIRLNNGANLDLTNVAVSGIAKIVGSAGGDTIAGSKGNDVIEGGAGNDRLLGGVGDDTLNAGTGSDQLDGGAGFDIADFSGLTTSVTVDLAAQTVQHLNAANSTTLIAIEGATGGEGADTLLGSDMADRLSGGAGNDRLEGRDGNDILVGGAGNDLLFGQAGDDIAQLINVGDNAFDGGEGIDTASFAANTLGVNIDLSVINGLHRLTNVENLTGGLGSDTLRGNDGNNFLNGGSGNDSLIGGAGDDELEGGSGDDRFFGGAGFNTLVYRGKQIGYTIDTQNKTITDIDTSDGDDGFDTYEDINLIRFAGSNTVLGVTPNNTPTINPLLPDVSQDDNQSLVSLSVRNSFVDIDIPNGDSLKFVATLADNSQLPTWLTFDPITASFSYIAGGAPAGTVIDVKVKATDNSGASVEDIFRFVLNEGRGASLNGTSGVDVISGTFRGEDINLYAGNDVVFGTNGADRIDGGFGFDRISYRDSTVGITIALDGGPGVGGHAQGDTLVGIEALEGSEFNDHLTAGNGGSEFSGHGGDDTLRGNAGVDNFFGDSGNDVLVGGAGDDFLEGGSGSDQIDGGDGNDWVRYTQAQSAVTIDLLNTNANSGDAAGDTYVNVERIHGSVGYGDTLLGDDSANIIVGDGGDDVLNGRGGNDDLRGDAGSDTLLGDAGDDELSGGEHSDSLYGGVGDDRLFGGNGDDLLNGGAGRDFLNGGAGIDTVSYDEGTGLGSLGVTVDLANITNNLGSAAGDSYIDIEQIIGSRIADTLRGDVSANILHGGAGDDIIAGREGNDNLQGQDGNDTIDGDGGNDELFGNAGADTLRGGQGFDRIEGGADNDVISGGTENDTLYGNEGFDTLTGDEGDDTLYGGLDNDELRGGAGADKLFGEGGNDTAYLNIVGEDEFDGGLGIDTANFSLNSTGINVDLRNIGNSERLINVENVVGGSGDDTIRGNESLNQLEGGAGNDIILGSLGADVLIGGTGIDTVSYTDSAIGDSMVKSELVGSVSFSPPAPGTALNVAGRQLTLDGVRVSLSNTGGSIPGAGGHAEGDILVEVESIIGSNFGDQLVGASTDDQLDGGLGDDLIFGGGGNDILNGDSGDDILYGGDGIDTLAGGSGNDRLFGGGQHDLLIGGDGNDILEAGDDGDALKGGSGDDILIGGSGGDTYFIGRNGGHDTVYNFDNDVFVSITANDGIVFEDGIKNTQLWFQKSGRDLVVRVLADSSGPGGTTTTIKDWFTNNIAGDYSAQENFVVDVFIAGQNVAGHKVSLPTLLGLMEGQAVPATFESLDINLQSKINTAWKPNQAPILTIRDAESVLVDRTQPVAVAEDGVLVFHVSISDQETSPSGLTLEAQVNGELLPAVVSPTGAGTYTVTVRGLANKFGTGQLMLRAFDGGVYSDPQVINVDVKPVADGLTLGAANTTFAVNMGAPLLLTGLSVTLKDLDGSEIVEDLFIDGLPAGAVLSSGAHSFTATSAIGSVNIRGWNGGNLQQTLSSLTVTPPLGSSTDFTLRLRGRSRDGNPGSFVSSQESSSANITIAVNAPPTGVSLALAGLNENVVGGLVGILGALGDPDNTGNYRYEIVGGADQAKFVLTGTNNSELRLAAGQSLNFEAIAARVDIRAIDNTTGTALVGGTTTLSITPNNVAERPNTPAAVSNASINDGAGSGTVVANLNLSAVDEDGGALTFEIVGGSNLFEVVGTQIRVRSGQVVDFDGINGTSIPFHDLEVVARDTSGLESAVARSIRITVNPVDEAPTLDINNNQPSITLNELATGVWGGIVLNGRDDEGQAVSYEIQQGGASSLFNVSGTGTGGLLRLNGALDYDGSLPGFGAINNSGIRSTTIYIRSKTATGPASDYQAFTFNLSNVDEAPSTPAAVGPLVIDENSGFSQIFDLGSVDPEGAEVDYTFALQNSVSGNPGGLFEIINSAGSGLAIRLLQPFDFETVKNQGYYTAKDATSGTITIKLLAVDADINAVGVSNIANNLRSVVRDIIVTVRNVDEAPFNVSSRTPVINLTEGFQNGIGSSDTFTGVIFDAQDVDNSAPIDFVFANGTTSLGNLRLIGHGLHVVAGGIDFETFGPNYSFDVFALSDGKMSATPIRQSITIKNENDNPTVFTSVPGTLRITENANILGTITSQGQLRATDADNLGITYSIVGGNINRPNGPVFQIDPNTGVIGYGNGGVDYEDRNWQIGGSTGKFTDLVIRATGGGIAINGAAQPVDTVVRIEVQDISIPVVTNGVLANGYSFSVIKSTRTIDEFDRPSFYNERWILDSVGRVVLHHGEFNSALGQFAQSILGQGVLASGYSRILNSNGSVTIVKSDEDSDASVPGIDPVNGKINLNAPIVLDLDGDGLDLISLADSLVSFDQNGDGILDRTGYVGADDGLLVYDRNRNGIIENGSEISFVGDKEGAKTDLEGLAGLDTDNDGFITSTDSRFAELQVWQDRNQDGISQADELRTLEEAGIVSIVLNGVSTGQTTENTSGNIVFKTSQFKRRDGSSSLLGDVALAYLSGSQPVSLPVGEKITPPAEISSPPLLNMYAALDGTIPNIETISRSLPGLDDGGALVLTDNIDAEVEVRSAVSSSMLRSLSEDVQLAIPALLEGMIAPPPMTIFQTVGIERKAEHFAVASQQSQINFAPRKSVGTLDPRAGMIGNATILKFRDRSIGIYTPIVIDLDGDGIELRSRKKSHANFDVDGDGIKDKTGWVGRGDGLLVIDRNNDGLITSTSELLFQTERSAAANSFDALAEFDDNADGRLTLVDRRFNDLKIWIDANGNGDTDAGELRSLDNAGITAINLSEQTTDQSVKVGRNLVLATSSFTRSNGSTGTVGSAGLAFDPSSALKSLSATTAPKEHNAELTEDSRRKLQIADNRLVAMRNVFESGISPEDGVSSIVAELAELGDARLLQMVQAMSVFGATSASENKIHGNGGSTSLMEWFA